MKRVFFDESGNTGQNLLDEADPIFVLSSCSFDPSQEQEAFTHLQAFKGPELKFSRLRKTPAGQRAVLAFLRSEAVNSTTAAAVVFHKPFMVVTKYCDLILEPSMRDHGVDFYARGLNMALANLLTTTMPVFLNRRSWTDFLALFVQLVRERTRSLFNQWQNSAELLYAHLEHSQPTMARLIAPVFLIRDANEFFETLNDNELDPLVPAYHLMAAHWGRSIGGLYELIADTSKVLAKERGRLLTLSDQNLKPVTIGYDRRKSDLPLKVADIIAVDSTAHRQIQFADIIGGAIASAAKAKAKGVVEAGTFLHDVFELYCAKGLLTNAVWPNPEVDPKKLGTDINPSPDDIDAATYIGMVLSGHPATKKTGP